MCTKGILLFKLKGRIINYVAGIKESSTLDNPFLLEGSPNNKLLTGCPSTGTMSDQLYGTI